MSDFLPGYDSSDRGIDQGEVRVEISSVGYANIDIGAPGPTPNDPGNADTGANYLQNTARVNP